MNSVIFVGMPAQGGGLSQACLGDFCVTVLFLVGGLVLMIAAYLLFSAPKFSLSHYTHKP